MSDLVAIPQPKPLPLVGNLRDIDPEKGVLSLSDLAAEYGPIFRFTVFGREQVVVSSQRLVDELCDESRFVKHLSLPLEKVRDFAGDGLFTAHSDEPNWGAAHRILMPAFGPAALRRMFDGMAEIADQLLLKWERLGPEHVVDVADNTTRLTLDTIALCSFGYRFNSFYSDDMHPFVDAMVRSLLDAGDRTRRLPVQEMFAVRARRQAAADRALMNSIADRLVADRRRRPSRPGQEDILDTMLTAADPTTGERLSDENVRNQLVTFLIAGHETTSGLLTFTLYALLRHPEVLAAARAQVDQVLGDRAPRFEDLAKLTYLDQILKESLRLWPTAPAFAVTPIAEQEVLDGRYLVRRGVPVIVLAMDLHRDPEVWGPDPERFDPDRFAFDRAAALPPNAWKPFGNGQRSCIGRGFALQEAQLFLAMLLQRFDLVTNDPDYRLAIKQTLTIKPDGLTLRVRRRDRVITAAPTAEATATAEPAPAAPANGVPIRVFYGSNAGMSESFARRIATDATLRGYTAAVAPLDEAVDAIEPGGAVVVITSSYEGQPPDNARGFVSWLRARDTGAFTGVRHAVFGCGNTDWARTYQAIPTLVDDLLTAGGSAPLLARGAADARGDFFGDFDDWYAGFWARVADAFGVPDTAPAAPTTPAVAFVGAPREAIVERHRLVWATVAANRELVDVSAPGARSKRHLEIALPADVSYVAGDYLAVLPTNPAAVVERALRRFDLAADARIVLRGGATFLPTDAPIAVADLLGGYVELSAPATRQQIGELAAATPCPPDRAALTALTQPDAYAARVLEPRLSVLDLLERFPACLPTFADFLGMLGPLTPRQYSISSSPRWRADRCTLTVAVLAAPALSGNGIHRGAASSYLADAAPGDRVAVAVRPSPAAFAPPPSVTTPIVMACAGSGIAPFVGFLQDRALQAAAEGVEPGPALLFFGCDAPDVDFLYRDELAAWARQGVVDVRPAFSEAPVEGVRFVQDRLWADRADVVDLVRAGAVFYVCGDGRAMAPAVYDTCARIHAEATSSTAEQSLAWLREMQQERRRYVADVFA